MPAGGRGHGRQRRGTPPSEPIPPINRLILGGLADMVATPLALARKNRSMKLVIAIIKPFKLEEVRDALTAIGVHGMTITEVKGYGRQKGHKIGRASCREGVNFLPKIGIEDAEQSESADRVVEAIG